MSLLALSIVAPLLVKTSAVGFAPAEWRHSEKCEIYSDRVVVTKTYGDQSVQTKFSFSGELALKKLIARARSKELKETDNYLCDGPYTSVVADDLVIYSTGGCSVPKREREGGAAHALLDIVAIFCPTTY